jgi:hypothetical protein
MDVNASELKVEVEGYLDTMLSDPGGLCSFSNILNMIKYGVLFGVPCYLCYRIVSTCSRPVGRVVFSYYIEFLKKNCRQPRLTATTLRSIFGSLGLVQPRVPTIHYHPESAANRNASTDFISRYSANLGCDAYFMQKSAADERNGRHGSRAFFWHKDVSATASSFNPGTNDVLGIVDTDMYLDMPELLAKHPRTYVISTFQPEQVSYAGAEYSFTFNNDGQCVYRISGGAVFNHWVWNYGTDVLMTSTRIWCGLATKTTIYNVDRKRSSNNHQLILLTPIKTLIFVLYDFSSWLGGSTLRRLNPVVETIGGSFLRLYLQQKDGLFVSTGKPGEYNCATIPVAQDDTIKATVRVSKVDLCLAQVKAITDDSTAVKSTILTEFHRNNGPSPNEYVYPISECVYRYQYDPESYDPDAKPSMIPFMHPIIADAFAPDKCRSNDLAAVHGRVLSVKPPDNIVMTPSLLKYQAEFLEFLIPTPHQLHPVSIEEVFARQNRPAQRNILEQAVNYPNDIDERKVQTFQKSEIYDKPADPRIITTIPGKNKLTYSQFVYAFTTILRDTKWYAFGKTPAEVACRVAEICKVASEITATDLSRFDGRVSIILRELERKAMLRAFHEDYTQEILEIMATQKDRRAVTKFFVAYLTYLARLSGSAETADFNSLDNAFMAYAAKRETRRNGVYLTPLEAWNELGVYGGDDGITPDVDPQVYTRICASVGQLLELAVFKRGSPGVNFLARYFSPLVWFGDSNSMCDVKRQLSKLHASITLPPNISSLDKLGQKLTGFSFTDLNTPIIGDLVRTFKIAHPTFVNKNFGVGELRTLPNYASLYPINVQYPNVYGDWMEDIVRVTIPGFDRGLFNSWLSGVAANNRSILVPPICVDLPSVLPTVSKPVVINGDIISPPKLANQIPTVLDTKEKVCRIFQTTGKCKFGDKCKFSHLPPSVVSPCRDFRAGKCTYGVRCKHSHTTTA